MAAVLMPAEDAHKLIVEGGFEDVEVAAVNSSKSITVSGVEPQIRAMARLARSRRVPMRILEVDYPFHTALVDGIRVPLISELAGLSSTDATVSFVSAVTGELMDGTELDASYWWHNVRRPVRFADAVATAIREGARLFLEIGPKPTLQTYIADGMAAADVAGAAFCCSDYRLRDGRNPVRHTIAQLVARGAAVDRSRVFGELRGRPERLPTYRWQNRRFLVTPSVEMHDLLGMRGVHPLIGARSRADGTEWTADLDSSAVPYLGDHRVHGRLIMPAAALAEMALAAGRAWLDSATVELQDFEIVRPLVLGSDALLEVMTRISAESRTIEILSRPRLRDEARTLHAFGRFGTIPSRAAPSLRSTDAEPASVLKPTELYRLASVHGLDYGAAFQSAECVETLSDGRIRVLLRQQNGAELAAAGYGLYPPALDGCFHGLIGLFAARKSEAGSDVAYLPIRFGEIRLYRPSVPIRTALLTVKRQSDRSLTADFVLLDDSGELVASLEDCRFRAVAVGKQMSFDHLAYHYGYELLEASPSAERAILSDAVLQRAAKRAQITVDAPAPRGDDDLLLEAFAVSLAYETTASASSRRRRCTVSELVAQGRVSAQRVPLFQRLLGLLKDHGHADVDGEYWRIARDIRPPRAAAVLRTLVSEHPERSAEAVLGARAAQLLPRVLREGTLPEPAYLPSTVSQFVTASPPACRLVEALARFVHEIIAEWPADRPLRILEIDAGAGALTRHLTASIGVKPITLVATDPDAVAVERLRFAFGSHPGVRTQVFDPAVRDSPDLGRFDLVVAASPLSAALRNRSAVQRLELAVAEGGALAMAVLGPSGFTDVVFGLEADWFDRTAVPEFPIGRLRSAREWTADLQTARFEVDVSRLAGMGDPAYFVRAAASRRPLYVDQTRLPHADLLLVGTARDRPFADALARAFELSGRSVRFVDRVGYGKDSREPAAGDFASLLTDIARTSGAESAVVDVVALSSPASVDSPTDTVTAWIDATLALARAVTDKPARLWVVASGAFQGIAEGGRDWPQAGALAGFLRVLINETRGLDVRIIDPDPNLDRERTATELAHAVLHPSAEREIVITEKGVCAPRVRRGLPRLDPSATTRGPVRQRAARLASGTESRLDDLAWAAGPVPEPKSGQLAIDVAAAGLNFRDVMWALGLLPEEALEDGYAGPSLGLEAAGTVVAIGAGVRRFKPGDRVMAFASGAFASRIVVPEVAVAPLPSRIGFDAGATIPVAFLTAYYALRHLARLRRGEWVLVHGGAGGVGLAALQIARWLGARTILTAGSEDKRDFLRVLGADHVLSSRTLDFVDQLRAITRGRGVDVVLNSLAGEAMERSLRALRPFGRFLELGKRDYYANTRIGLRPFRQNVSYFGIDADQLLAHRQPLTERLFRDIVRLFEQGVFVPLPFRAFGSGEVRDAFRLMQQSLHVGKIVVTPPPVVEERETVWPAFAAAADATHVVIGGLGGFGLATAEWLAERGARHLALVSRRAALTPESERTLERLRERGVQIKVASCDVADATALAHLFDELTRTMPLIRGVIHAAMVLDDALIANLDTARFAAVMRPKIDGAANLDRLTRGLSLDYFLLFSSATTLVGNPGQANYVAANAYLESLARNRRADGLPALAVAWGAIADVGYLARKTDVRDKLSRRLGQAALTAREALDALGRLLVETDGGNRASAALVVAPIDWSTARRELRLLASPAYTQVVSDAELAGAGRGDDRIDLAALVHGRDAHAARDAVAEVLAGEVSRILKLPLKEVGTLCPLAELGMDSLMALELQLSAERRLGVELPTFAVSDSTTLASIAGAIVARVQNPEQAEEGNPNAEMDTVIRRHVTEDLSVEDLAEFREAVRSRESAIERIV